MCNMDCFHCTMPDCVIDDVTPAERKNQDEHDREIKGSRKYGRYLSIWNYQHSEKGIEALRRYNSSEKGKERHRRYMNTDKGREIRRIQSRKRVESGKNAEYCRAYYQRKKAERSRNEGNI